MIKLSDDLKLFLDTYGIRKEFEWNCDNRFYYVTEDSPNYLTIPTCTSIAAGFSWANTTGGYEYWKAWQMKFMQFCEILENK